MKLRPDETKLIELLSNAGGSICLDVETRITSEVRRIANALERKGVLIIEATDAGPRLTLRETVHG
jgi:hypothetical protein